MRTKDIHARVRVARGGGHTGEVPAEVWAPRFGVLGLAPREHRDDGEAARRRHGHAQLLLRLRQA